MPFKELYKILDPDMYVFIYYDGILNAVFEGSIQEFYEAESLSTDTVVKISYDEFDTNTIAIYLGLH